MRVAQLMSVPVVTCHSMDTLESAVGKMWENECGALPVLDAHNRLVGILTDRDAAMAAYVRRRPLIEVTVRDAMTQEVVTCRPDDLLAEAEEVFQQNAVRRLPVVDDASHVVGMIAIDDLAREAAREKFLVKKEVTATEVTDTLAIVSQGYSPSPF